MCLFAPAPYYKLNKGFFLGFLFKPLGVGGLRPPRDLNKKASEKYPLFITYIDALRVCVNSWLAKVQEIHVENSKSMKINEFVYYFVSRTLNFHIVFVCV